MTSTGSCETDACLDTNFIFVHFFALFYFNRVALFYFQLTIGRQQHGWQLSSYESKETAWGKFDHLYFIQPDLILINLILS